MQTRAMRDRINREKVALWNERSSYFAHWMDLSAAFLPRNGKFFLGENRGAKRFNSIIDNEGTLSVDVLTAGLISGMTSPARPWFRFAPVDFALADDYDVNEWLATCTEVIHTIFHASNTYETLGFHYKMAGVFGVSAGFLLDDYDDVIRHYPSAIGEFALATDQRGEVATFVREFSMSADQLIAEFGESEVSDRVKRAVKTNPFEPISVIHYVGPRKDRDATLPDNKNMAVASVYFESAGDPDKILRESGFERFPVLAPRWDPDPGEVYGTSPCMRALGDVRQLQHQQKSKGHAINLALDPPKQAPVALKNRDIDTLPGSTTFFDQASPHAGIRPLFEVPPIIEPLSRDMDEVRLRIRRALHVDLFMLLANRAQDAKTATEAAIMDEERRMILGPVLTQFHRQLLEPLVMTTFERAFRAGILPPPPDAMLGRELKVEFISTLAQAQKAIGLGAMDRLIGTVTALGTIRQEAFDKLDVDQVIDDYADKLGVHPKDVVPTKKLAVLRKARAEALAAKEQAAMQEVQSKTAKNLAGSPTGGGAPRNALMDVNNLFSNYSVPSPLETRSA